MSFLKKSGIWLSILGILFLQAPAHAGMVSTSEVLLQSEKIQLVNMLEREDVQQKLADMGVDHQSSLSRVEQMTDEEIAQLKDHFSELPVGAGLSTIDLLIIVIIIILLV